MNTENNALDFRDPGPVPSELLNVPGLVNAIKDHTLATSYSPNETLAPIRCASTRRSRSMAARWTAPSSYTR